MENYLKYMFYSIVRKLLKTTELRKIRVTFFFKYIEIQVNKANKILGVIRRSYKCIDNEMLKILFIDLVRLHLEFSNLVWFPTLIKNRKLIGVQKRTCKLISEFRNMPYELRLRRIKLIIQSVL